MFLYQNVSLSQNPRQSQNAVRDGTSCIKWRGTLASWGLDMRETKVLQQGRTGSRRERPATVTCESRKGRFRLGGEAWREASCSPCPLPSPSRE